MKIKLLITFTLFFVGASYSFAQTTEFTYQGKLTDNNLPANSSYDFEFRLYDAASGGTLVGTQQLSGIPVSGGVFTVRLNFGASAFSGANRFLEIALKPAGNAGGYQQLLPRQPVTSAPQAIRSLSAATSDSATNASHLGGIAANHYVLTGDLRLADARNPLPNSPNYVQNTSVQQTASNFNISGTGKADIFEAATQYNIDGSRVLSIPGNFNFFAGILTGNSNITGYYNSFFGARNGENNTTGYENSFFGTTAGFSNTTGNANSFFGSRTGYSNTIGGDNSFFGYGAGSNNTTGSQNSFVGRSAGQVNTTGTDNTFVGQQAGRDTSSGAGNVFVGSFTGDTNSTGSNNTAIGYGADVNSGNLSFATAIGAGAIVSTGNTIVLGRTNGVDKIRIFGLGSSGTTPLCRNTNSEISTCSASLTDTSNNTALLETIRKQQDQINHQQMLIEGLQKLICRQNREAAVCKEYK